MRSRNSAARTKRFEVGGRFFSCRCSASPFAFGSPGDPALRTLGRRTAPRPRLRNRCCKPAGHSYPVQTHLNILNGRRGGGRLKRSCGGGTNNPTRSTRSSELQPMSRDGSNSSVAPETDATRASRPPSARRASHFSHNRYIATPGAVYLTLPSLLPAPCAPAAVHARYSRRPSSW